MDASQSTASTSVSVQVGYSTLNQARSMLISQDDENHMRANVDKQKDLKDHPSFRREVSVAKAAAKGNGER